MEVAYLSNDETRSQRREYFRGLKIVTVGCFYISGKFKVMDWPLCDCDGTLEGMVGGKELNKLTLEAS